MVERSLSQGSSNLAKDQRRGTCWRARKNINYFTCVMGTDVPTVTGQVQGKVRVSQKPDHMGPLRLCLGAWTWCPWNGRPRKHIQQGSESWGILTSLRLPCEKQVRGRQETPQQITTITHFHISQLPTGPGADYAKILWRPPENLHITDSHCMCACVCTNTYMYIYKASRKPT